MTSVDSPMETTPVNEEPKRVCVFICVIFCSECSFVDGGSPFCLSLSAFDNSKVVFTSYVTSELSIVVRNDVYPALCMLCYKIIRLAM